MDGAVAAYLVGDVLTMKLCLNPCSRRWESLRNSPFARQLKLGLIDPVAEERAGKAYIVDGEVTRSNEHEVLQFLERKYGLVRAQSMDFHMASAAVLAPK
jgi:hypothetical protein